MATENMHSSAPPLARRSAVSARQDKEQPALPPDATSAATQRSSTPTTGTRTQRAPPKPTRSATVDHSMSPGNTLKQAVQPSAPSGLPVPPGLSAHPGLSNPPVPLPPSPPAGPVQGSPGDDWEAIASPNALVEDLQGKIAELKTTIQQRDSEIKQYQDEMKQCQNEILYYRTKSTHLESDAYRQEVLSIRRHLQVDEPCEPWEITKRFGEIVRKVEDISRDMSDELGRLTPIAKPTTLSFLKLLLGESESQSLAAAMPTVNLDIEDFIDFGCRALINQALHNSILSPSVFHPGLKPEENHRFCEMYYHIRKQEPQVVSGQWRIATLKLHTNRTYSPKDQVHYLCESILLPFCGAVVETASCIEPIRSIIPRLEELFEQALKWNRLAKNSFIMLDFHPQYQPPGSSYDKFTALEGRKPKLPASKAILLTSKLGLWSSNAVGGGNDPECSIQIKATMLAAEYFA